MDDHTKRYSVQELKAFSEKILTRVGLDPVKAQAVAETLIEADLMGHTTHGLQLLPVYVQELEAGNMLSSGQPDVVNDGNSTFTWNGNYLPGPWLVHKSIDEALRRARYHPVVTVVIQRCHHIACLAAYLKKVTDKGMMILLSCSDPINKTVAPYGATKGVYSPNPLAAGIPTKQDPILIDVSMSVTANAQIKRSYDEGKKLSQPWLLSPDGELTDDPISFYTERPSTILPIGGLDAGYKGFALGILIEALTSALAGYGRADEPQRWTASVFLQIINPAAFGGTEAFTREMQFLTDACHAAGDVRMPGERALTLRAEQLEKGLSLYPSVIRGLQNLSDNFDIQM
jgi:LDH2 family malate/lactate/ureidoglycolate dehydrogenase